MTGGEVRGQLGWIAVGLTLVAVVLVPFFLLGPEIEGLAEQWLRPGRADAPLLALAIVALLAGDVALPVPSSLVSVAAVALFGWAGGLLIWIGMTLGCGLGYWVGSRAGRPLAERFVGPGEIARARRLAGEVGPAALVLTRAVPVLAEATTIAAGLAAMPPLRFALATGLANAGIALVYVAAAGSFVLLAAAAILVPAIGWAAQRLFRRFRGAA